MLELVRTGLGTGPDITPVLTAGATVALLAVAGCSLDRLLDPGEGGATTPGITTLTIAPLDTVLDSVGASFCYRWEARDAAGSPRPDVTPAFTVDSTAPVLLEISGAPGCVRATMAGTGTPARVLARAGDLEASAAVTVRGGAAPVTFLDIQPADTTLTTVGGEVCYRWTARDGTGAVLTGVTPVFSLRNNPGQRLAQNTQNQHCFSVVSLGTVNATVDAVTDSATATATLRVRP